MSQFAVYRVKDQTKAPWQLSYFEVLEQKISIREQDYQQIYLKHALMIEWCIEKGIDPTEDNLAKYFKLHLERGISYLTGTNFIKSLDDLLNLATEE